MGHKVITAPNLAALIPMVELLRHLKDESADANRQAEVQAFLAAAHAHAQHHCGKSFGSQTLELALDAFPEGGILLPGLPVASITSVKYLDETGAEQTLDGAAYSLDNYDSQEHWLLPTGDWPATIDSPNAVKVRYQAGETAHLQHWASVRNALLLHVAALDMNRDNAEPPPAVAALLNTEKVWAI
ncbi:MAG TPA: hypothetical protein DDX06_04440 [Curvibacter sp.]|nr:hypothetical protein [Curvibacter sp.]